MEETSKELEQQREYQTQIFCSEEYYDDKLIFLHNVDMKKMMEEDPETFYITLQALMPIPIRLVFVPKINNSDLIAESASVPFNIISLVFWKGGKQLYMKEENQKPSEHMKYVIKTLYESYIIKKKKEIADLKEKLKQSEGDEELANKIDELRSKLLSLEQNFERTTNLNRWLDLIGLECLYGDQVQIIPYSKWAEDKNFIEIANKWKEIRKQHEKSEEEDNELDPLLQKINDRQIEIYNYIENQKIAVKKKKSFMEQENSEKKPKGRGKKYQAVNPTPEIKSTRGRKKKVVSLEDNNKTVKLQKKRAGCVSVGIKAIKPEEEWNTLKKQLGDALVIDSEDVPATLQAIAGLLTEVRNRQKNSSDSQDEQTSDKTNETNEQVINE